MGLVEEVMEHVSIKVSLIALAAGLVLYWLYSVVETQVRLRKLGGARAPGIPHYLPFSLDTLYISVKAMVQNKNLEMWREWLGSHGGVSTIETTMAGRRIVFTIDPENIKAVLATQFGDYGKGESFHREWEPLLGDSIFATDGEKWHTSRQMLRPQFIKDRVSDLHTFEAKLQILFRAMANGGALGSRDQQVDPRAVNGRVIDICELFFRYTLDVATEFLLGKDVESLTTPHNEFAEAFADVQAVQSVISRAGPLNALVPRAKYRAGLRVMDRFINMFIERALRLSPQELESKSRTDLGYTFLHELASFTRDRKVLRDQLVAVLLAGRDTTASALSWAMYELGRHPECVRRLRAEVLEVVGAERTPTYDDLKGMKYLQNTLNEVLRLYPGVPFNVRLALRDALLPRGGGPDGGLPVPVLAGTPVAYSTLAMQRRPDLYPAVAADGTPLADPAVFSPERWFHWQPRPWQYVPFNGGPRICIGQQFALTEMGYTLVRFFQRFDRVVSYMAESDGGDPVLKAEIVLQPGDGVRVAFWEAGK